MKELSLRMRQHLWSSGEGRGNRSVVALGARSCQSGSAISEVYMGNGDKPARALIKDPVFQKRLAKYLVQRCVRNSVLEDLHARTAPNSKTGDYSDIVVVTPFGEIPWRRVSRFDDAEMKALMIDVVQRAYEFLRELFDEDLGGGLVLRLAERDPLSKWENPT